MEIHMDRLSGRIDHDGEQGVKELLRFAESYQQCAPNLEAKIKLMTDGFVRTCAQAILDGTLRGHDLLKSLRQRAQTQYFEQMTQAKRLTRLNDSVPAVGWALSIMAAFWLLRNPQEISFDQVATGIGLLCAYATYALVFHYFVMAPAIRYVIYRARQERLKNLVVVEGVRQVMEKRQPYEILDVLNLSLPTEQRLEWSEVFPHGKREKAA